MRTSCALQNKNRTFKTTDMSYLIIWSEIIFFLNISDHDVGSPLEDVDGWFAVLCPFNGNCHIGTIGR